MTFQKDYLQVRMQRICCIIIALICPILVLFAELEIWLVSVFFALLSIVCLLGASKLYDEYITINENGISCSRKGTQIWAYAWDDIVALQRGTRYSQPSMDIIVPSPCRALDSCREIPGARGSGHYFQLSKTAKQALALYYKDGVILPIKWR